MLRKLASLFFEEEEEVIEEEVKETKKPELPPIAANVEKKPVRIDLETTQKPNENAKNSFETTQKPSEIVKNSATAGIPVVKESNRASSRIDLSSDFEIKQHRTVNENNVVYEFQPVISPIFGVSEKDKKTIVVKKAEPPQPVRHSPLQTIISPIYGVTKKDDKDEPETEPEFVVAPSDSTIEIKNLTLDELLREEEIERERTLEQFSLFEDITKPD